MKVFSTGEIYPSSLEDKATRVLERALNYAKSRGLGTNDFIIATGYSDRYAIYTVTVLG